MDQPPSQALWASFPHDPRDPAAAPLRASDADRELVHRVLADAFAAGRLTREEYDERTAVTLSARTLGELPAMVVDLVPDRPLTPVRMPLSVLSASDLHDRAVAKWREQRREAMGAFVFLSVLCWTIWVAVGFATGFHFAWPAIVTAVTGLNMLRVLTSKGELVESELQKLQRRQAKELRALEKKRQPDS